MNEPGAYLVSSERGANVARPLGVTFAAIGASVVVLVCLAATFALILWIPGWVGASESDPVSSRFVGFLFLEPPLVLLGACAAGIAYAVLRGRPWSRDLLVVFWIALSPIALAMVSASDGGLLALPAAMMPLGVVLISLVYLYGKPNVNAYYDHLLTKPSNGPRARRRPA